MICRPRLSDSRQALDRSRAGIGRHQLGDERSDVAVDFVLDKGAPTATRVRLEGLALDAARSFGLVESECGQADSCPASDDGRRRQGFPEDKGKCHQSDRGGEPVVHRGQPKLIADTDD